MDVGLITPGYMDFPDFIKSLSDYPHRHFLSGGLFSGKDGALRLARDIGWCFADFPKQETKKALGIVYGTVIVKNHIECGLAIPIDNKPFVEALIAGEQERRQQMKTAR